jgi:hypothetical protein
MGGRSSHGRWGGLPEVQDGTFPCGVDLGRLEAVSGRGRAGLRAGTGCLSVQGAIGGGFRVRWLEPGFGLGASVVGPVSAMGTFA